MTRKQLAQLSGLPLSTIADVTRRLVDEGVLYEETGPRSGRAGRPATVLRLCSPSGVVAVLRVTRGGLQAGLISTGGRVLAVSERAFDFEAAEPGPGPLVELLNDALATAGLDRAAVSETVLALPAPVDGGRIVPLRIATAEAPSVMPATPARLRWIGDDPGGALERLLSLPVRVENDANLEALGEATFGAARTSAISLHVMMVGGLGGGVVVHKQLIRGAVGFAGELAHMHLDDDGPMCACGGRGCLAGRADVHELVRLMQPAFDQQMTLEKVIALCADGDQPSWRALCDLGRVIGAVLGAACVLLNPDAITIDGALDAAVRPVIEGVRDGVVRNAPGPTAESVQIMAGSLGGNALLFGALALVFPYAQAPWVRTDSLLV